MNNNDASTGLRIELVTSGYPHIERILDIRDEVFPANERIATRKVSQYNKANGYITLAFVDDNEVVGFMQLYDCGDDVYYGIYLAIAKEFQNRHYGSRALKLVLEEYLKGKMMFGCVEALIPEAENYQQRVNRVRFFRRNGLFLLDGVIDGGERGKFQFICTDPNVTFEQLNAQFVTYKVE